MGFDRSFLYRIRSNRSPAISANGRINFLVDLAPGESWHTCCEHEFLEPKRIWRSSSQCCHDFQRSENAAELKKWKELTTSLTSFGLPFSNYTGVLIGATAIPVWHESINTLPLHFGMSGLSSGVAALELMGHDHSRGLNLLGVLAAAVETWQGYHIETTVRPAVQPLKHGVSGWLTRTGGVLSGPVPLALRLGSLLSGSRGMRRIAAVCGFTGSLVTRYAWMKAGHASIRDSQFALGRSEG